MNALRLILSPAAILALGLAAQPATAQTIRGTLVDKATGSPFRGGFVVLLSDSGVALGRTLTDLRGEFALVAPAAGRYRLKSAIIGVKTELSSAIDVGSDEVVNYRFEIAATLISLKTLVVEGERTCEVEGPSGLAAATLWGEAQKALNAVAWTERQGMLRHRLVQYEKELDPQSLEIREQEFSSEEGVFQGSPFMAPTAENLAKKGFIQRTRRNSYYYGPDAAVLLSDEFADLHCFSISANSQDKEGLVGLAFEPIPDRKVSDIQGVIWMDDRTAELRFLEYGYTMLPWDIDASHIGGRIDFEHLSKGTWIVRRWWIRAPVVLYRRASIYRGEDPFLEAITETGGWVSLTQTADGETVSIGRASLTGVLAGGGSAPVADASIILVGPDYTETRTDSAGRFWFQYLTPGTYAVTYAIAETSEFLPPPGELALSSDQAVTIRLTVPIPSARRSFLCPNSNLESAFGTVSGLVRDAITRQPLGDARIVLSGNRLVAKSDGTMYREAVHVEGISDWTGYYKICDVPSGVTLDVQAHLTGWTAPPTSIRIMPRSISRVDVSLTAVEVPGRNN